MGPLCLSIFIIVNGANKEAMTSDDELAQDFSRIFVKFSQAGIKDCAPKWH